MITGNTKLYVIIANPVLTVRTPEVLNEMLNRNNSDAVIVPIQVSPDNLESMVAAFRAMENLGGIVVSNPHKTAMSAWCDEVSAVARAIGSVNAIRREKDGRLIAEMFDGTGFIAGMRSQGLEPAGCKTLLIGGGGAAMAVAFALAQAGVASLAVTNPTRSIAQEIVTRVAEFCPATAIKVGGIDPTGYDLVINAVSLSLWEKGPAPIDMALLTPNMIVAETMMKPPDTPLLIAANEKGCTIHYGRHMLDNQLRLISNFIGATNE